nr:MORC family CW-type zinc finger protein [Ipomoea batatas]
MNASNGVEGIPCSLLPSGMCVAILPSIVIGSVQSMYSGSAVAWGGESPPSSASDVDNLNNSLAVDKVASAKGVGYPQVTVTPVITARNRSNFMRLLNFIWKSCIPDFLRSLSSRTCSCMKLEGLHEEMIFNNHSCLFQSFRTSYTHYSLMNCHYNLVWYISFAMDASRKSRAAFAAANPRKGEALCKEGMLSVRKALDFNFQDVDGFLRHVRIAMEAI